jgi:hypothetical protein
MTVETIWPHEDECPVAPELTNSYIQTLWYSGGWWCVDCSRSSKGRHGDDRAVVLQFRYFDESETMKLQTKISISQIRDGLSLAQESALIFGGYQSVGGS